MAEEIPEKRGRGAPLGNKNGVKNRPWRAAIDRALEKRSLVEKMEALDVIAEKVVEIIATAEMAEMMARPNCFLLKVEMTE